MEQKHHQQQQAVLLQPQVQHHHHQQQQTVFLQPQMQPSYGNVYTDLPVAKLKRLGILQIVLGSLGIVLFTLSLVFDPTYWFSSAWDFLFGCLMLTCGITALVILTQKNQRMVLGTTILSIIAAVLAAITLLVYIIILLGIILLGALISIVQEQQNQQRHSSNTTGTVTVTDTYYTTTPLGPSDGEMQLSFISVSLEIVFFIAELVVASLLAHVTLRIMRNAQLVPVNPVYTTVVYTQAQA